jgi:hypothetical protein
MVWSKRSASAVITRTQEGPREGELPEHDRGLRHPTAGRSGPSRRKESSRRVETDSPVWGKANLIKRRRIYRKRKKPTLGAADHAATSPAAKLSLGDLPRDFPSRSVRCDTRNDDTSRVTGEQARFGGG